MKGREGREEKRHTHFCKQIVATEPNDAYRVDFSEGFPIPILTGILNAVNKVMWRVDQRVDSYDR